MLRREIVVRFTLPRTLRARWTLAAAAAVLALSAVAWATVPNVFSAGSVVSSAQMNANFADLDGRLGALESTYCGSTSKIVDARLAATNGYATASTICQGVPGCGAGAHICSTAEMLRYTSAGNGNTTEGWIATGSIAYTSGGYPIDDCSGFTNNLGSAYGTSWSGFLRNIKTCNTSTLPILCCD